MNTSRLFSHSVVLALVLTLPPHSFGAEPPDSSTPEIQERGLQVPLPQPPGMPAKPSAHLPSFPHVTPYRPLPSARFTVQAPPGVHPLVHFYAEREKAAPPVIRKKLADLRAKIQRDRLRFDVGYTSVAGRRIEEVTGLKQPSVAELAAWVKQSSSIANELLRLEQQAIQEYEKLAAQLGLAHDPEVALRAILPPPTATAFDWTVLGKVSPVRNQGCQTNYSLAEDEDCDSHAPQLVTPCGSCWAFASVSALESSLLIRYNEITQLSPQYALDNAIFGSCSGGNAAEVFTQMMLLGTANEGDVPYHGQKFGQRAVFDNPYRALIWGIVGTGIAPATMQELKAALLQHGPLAVTLFAGDEMLYYTNGVYSAPPGSDKLDENHVVTLVGWDDAKGAWRIKNSWGSNWGEGGFGWVAYGTSHIARFALWVRALNLNLPLPPVLLHWIDEAKKLGAQFDQAMRAAADAANRAAAQAREQAGAAQRQFENAVKDAVGSAQTAVAQGTRQAQDAAAKAAQAADHAAQQAESAWDHAASQVPAPQVPPLPSCCHF